MFSKRRVKNIATNTWSDIKKPTDLDLHCLSLNTRDVRNELLIVL